VKYAQAYLAKCTRVNRSAELAPLSSEERKEGGGRGGGGGGGKKGRRLETKRVLVEPSSRTERACKLPGQEDRAMKGGKNR